MRKIYVFISFLLFSYNINATPVRIIYEKDGSITVIHPAPKSRRINETEIDWLERVYNSVMCDKKRGIDYIDYDDIDSSELPQSREYRDAWTGKKGVGIFIDKKEMDKIKEDKLVQEEIEKREKERISIEKQKIILKLRGE